jgi:cytochrome b
VPAALGALAGAAVSVITDPFQWVLIPAAQNIRALAPFVLASLGVLPVLAARYAQDHGLRPAGALVQVGLIVSLICIGVLTVLTGWLAPKDTA